MDTGTFTLWGFDGELEGNEHRLQARLPLFTRDGEDDVVYVARLLDWSPELPESDVLRVPAVQASAYGQRLQVAVDQEYYQRKHRPEPALPTSVISRVRPGIFVVVAGPRLVNDMLWIGLPVWGRPIQNGYFVQLMRSADFDHYAASLEKNARTTFDREIASGSVTAFAQAALRTMRNVGVGDLRAHLLRTLAGHRLAGETDEYRRVLRMAEVRLRDSGQQLEREVLQHIELSKHVPQPTETEGRRTNGVVEMRIVPSARIVSQEAILVAADDPDGLAEIIRPSVLRLPLTSLVSSYPDLADRLAYARDAALATVASPSYTIPSMCWVTPAVVYSVNSAGSDALVGLPIVFEIVFDPEITRYAQSGLRAARSVTERPAVDAALSSADFAWNRRSVRYTNLWYGRHDSMMPTARTMLSDASGGIFDMVVEWTNLLFLAERFLTVLKHSMEECVDLVEPTNVRVFTQLLPEAADRIAEMLGQLRELCDRYEMKSEAEPSAGD